MAPEERERGHLKQFDRLAAAAAKRAENCWLLELIFFQIGEEEFVNGAKWKRRAAQLMTF